MLRPITKKNSLPSLFLSNTRSLVNKIEDLEVVINQNDVDIYLKMLEAKPGFIINCVNVLWLKRFIY